ncbi:hypothetical protein BGZ54_009854 [Gamsiella multidivaricata]|nr:hypothetical protein BGZ54_009854 [Gamsiella multidivaricata]
MPRSSAAPSRINGGIVKLAVVPPAQSKDDTSIHHHHLARSHPLAPSSEPIERPIDALLPLVKANSESNLSLAALELGRISPEASSKSSSTGNELQMIHDGQRLDRQKPVDQDRLQHKHEDRRKTGDDAKGILAQGQALKTMSNSALDSSHVPQNPQRAGNNVDSKEDIAPEIMEDSKCREPKIIYAVVKEMPTKPAIPKLIGASGSGTVIVHHGLQGRHGDISSGSRDFSLVRRKNDHKNGEGESQQALLHSNMDEWESLDQTRRESLQSLASFSSTLDGDAQDDQPGNFDDRNSKEETSLLRKAEHRHSVVAKKGENFAAEKFGSDSAPSPKNPALAEVQRMLQMPQKYAGGTPLGTKKSESSPNRPILDSTDALFQPTAPLVTYPALDAYLSSLKPASFSDVPTTPLTPKLTVDSDKPSAATPRSKSKKAPEVDPREGMFPPLGKVPIGVTLDELKVNVTKPPGFFDQELQNVMLSSAVDGIMSGEASNIGISWMRLEIIRDFLQFVALYLSVSGNTFVNQRWLYATVNIIPALLSLDLPRAVGYGMVFLILFGLICFIALYTFKIMTRTDPNDDIEGLEVSSWSLRSKKQRIETISIVFVLTTLYLPLAKLSFDALVWSDTMWPIANPYTNTDFPALEPLGPSGIYRDPSDFCYVTSMKIQDLNFAYAIIPLAIFTLCANTFYFPLAIRRLVVLNLPRIDKYTEQGERRLDPDEEYKRLTNSDNCPYNFLYNGYRREHGTYKVVIMFYKLLAVIIVVLFSKDNCLFRGYERRTIEATRAGLQIVFTVSLIYRHYRTQPFLYASQNLSEYWSRACTVATSVIGLFIVLKVGPLSVNALGIMLVSTYVLMCIIVIWFVIRQTQKFQVMLKQIQQRLDFSLEIFNPRLNYFKHIKRRIWQETWTTTLLVEDSFKMPPGKVVAYSQSPHRPPYLLNFTGTVAERHVENLRIVRQIGLRSYSQACQFLTPTIVRKRALILRKFVGPDMYYAPEFMASNIKTYFGKAYVNQDPEIQRRRELRYQLRALDGKFVVRPFVESRGIQRGRESNGTMEMSLVNAPVSYKRGLFTIHRKKMSSWQGHNMNPGFSVTITYSDGEAQDPEGSSQLLHETTIGHDVIGITRDFQLTPALARLLRDNHALVSRGVKKVKKVMQAYQAHYREEAHRKDATLSYDFFINVYDNPTLKRKELEPLLLATEENVKVCHPSPEVCLAINCLYERMAAVNRTRCHQWWYLFWDDLFRKNHEEIPQLVPKVFSPAFPGSICYRPMSRPDLEKFLEKHGCWLKDGRAGFMHTGVLNRMYTFLNELVFGKMTGEQRQKQLELSTIERQRLEQLFLVTKARIQVDGTYKRMPPLEQYKDVDLETNGQGLGTRTSNGVPGRRVSRTSKKGWFESITPSRLRRQPSHPRLEHYSPGYIIPQTWQQKASQFTSLLIGGRPEDMISESDAEDDLDECEKPVQKRRKSSMSSIETLMVSGSAGSRSKLEQAFSPNIVRTKSDIDNMKAEQENLLQNQFVPSSEYQRRLQSQRKGSSCRESWTSKSTLGDQSMTDGSRREELAPLNFRQFSKQSTPYKQAQTEQSVEEKGVVVQGAERGPHSMDDDPDMASDAMSITSMSSEDYW